MKLIAPIRSVYVKIYLFIKWLLWDFSGLRLIWEKIRPPLESSETGQKRRPASFFLWIIGIYIALFGVASQRYEDRKDIIENRAHTIFTQLSRHVFKKTLSRIPRVQNMPCPYKPDIQYPLSIFLSLTKESIYEDMVILLKETIEDWKDSLDSVDLRYANLEDADLREANFQEAYLRHANIQGAYLLGANLQDANLGYANLQNANLEEANLQNTILWEVNLHDANLGKANLHDASLERADLKGVKELTIDQLCVAKTLFQAKMDREIQKQVEQSCPHLLKQSSLLNYDLQDKESLAISKNSL